MNLHNCQSTIKKYYGDPWNSLRSVRSWIRRVWFFIWNSKKIVSHPCTFQTVHFTFSLEMGFFNSHTHSHSHSHTCKSTRSQLSSFFSFFLTLSLTLNCVFHLLQPWKSFFHFSLSFFGHHKANQGGNGKRLFSFFFSLSVISFTFSSIYTNSDINPVQFYTCLEVLLMT